MYVGPDLQNAASDSVTSSGSDTGSVSGSCGGEGAGDGADKRHYAGYRRTNSFDRFPFMSRPLRSAGRPASSTGNTSFTTTYYSVSSLSFLSIIVYTTQLKKYDLQCRP